MDKTFLERIKKIIRCIQNKVIVEFVGISSNKQTQMCVCGITFIRYYHNKKIGNISNNLKVYWSKKTKSANQDSHRSHTGRSHRSHMAENLSFTNNHFQNHILFYPGTTCMNNNSLFYSLHDNHCPLVFYFTLKSLNEINVQHSRFIIYFTILQ